MGKSKRKRRKIKFRQSVRLYERNDATRVARRNYIPIITKRSHTSGNTLPKVEGRPPSSVAPVMRVKIRKKQ